MATQLPDIVARVRLDTSGLQAGVKDAAKRGSAIGSALGSAVGSLAGGGLAAAAGKLTEFAKGSVDAFAAVEDATGAAGVEFGKQLPSVVNFASKAASSFGLSKRAALEAQNTFGTLGKAAGLTDKPLADFSQKLTGLAGDLASFKGTSTQQAIDAVGAALRGESEPIRAYGVMLNDASIQAEGLALGLVKPVVNADKLAAANLRVKLATSTLSKAIKEHGSTSIEAQKAQGALAAATTAQKTAAEGSLKPLSATNKTLAIQSLILKQTKDAQGDYTRTSTSTANVQKTLQAATENAQAALGAKLAPTLTFLRELLLKVVQGATGLFGILNTIGGVVATVASAFQSAAGFVRDNALAFGVLAGGLIILNAQFIASTIALNAQVAAFVIQQTITKAATVVTEGFAAAQAVLNGVLAANPIGLVVFAIAALVAAIVIAYKNSETFRNIVKGAFDAVKAAAQAVADFFTKTVAPAFSTAFHAIQTAVSTTFGWIKDHWPLLLAIITGPIGLAVLAISRNWTAIKNGATSVVSWISTKFDTLVGFFTKLPGRISSVASTAFDGLKTAFRNVVNFIIRGLNRLHFNVPSVNTHLPGVGKIGGFSVGIPHIPELAVGGTLTGAGRVLVGERGPEYLDLPRGATVTPLDHGPTRLHPRDMQALGGIIGQTVSDALNGVANRALLNGRSRVAY